MISMTGFACVEKQCEDFTVTVEIKGYNNRFLEVQVNTSLRISRYEQKIREIISGICGRGKIDIFLRVKELNAPVNISVNCNAAKAYSRAFSDLGVCLGIDEKLCLSSLIKMDGVLEIEKVRDDEKYWKAIEPVLNEAVEIFQAERVREGKHTERDILNSLGNIETALQTVQGRVSDLENTVKENIKNLLANLSGKAAP